MSSLDHEQIREIRVRLGLSQERFARLLGVSLQSVRRWEAGLTKPLPIISIVLEGLERDAAGRATGRREPVGGKHEDVHGGPAEAEPGGILKGLGRFFDLAARMVAEGQDETASGGHGEGPGGLNYVYGFTVRVGPGGRPIIDRFGTVADADGDDAVVREPAVDVLEEEDEVVVVAELPGVEEGQVLVEVAGDQMELTASGRGRRYHKRLRLPTHVDERSLKRSYRNGILEVRCRKAGG